MILRAHQCGLILYGKMLPLLDLISSAHSSSFGCEDESGFDKVPSQSLHGHELIWFFYVKRKASLGNDLKGL